MPTRYQCNQCNLDVTLGWFHYHGHENGFGSETLIICSNCGKQYRIRIALGPQWLNSISRDRVCDVSLLKCGPRRIEVMRELRRLTCCDLVTAKQIVESLPTKIAEDISWFEAKHIRTTFEALQAVIEIKIANESVVNITQQQDELSVLEYHNNNEKWLKCEVIGERFGTTGEFDLTQQTCCSCNIKGGLISKLTSDKDRCPRCRQNSLTEKESWIT